MSVSDAELPGSSVNFRVNRRAVCATFASLSTFGKGKKAKDIMTVSGEPPKIAQRKNAVIGNLVIGISMSLNKGEITSSPSHIPHLPILKVLPGFPMPLR